MELLIKQIKLMFGLIGSGFTVQEHTPTNHVTLAMVDGNITTKITLIPKPKKK